MNEQTSYFESIQHQEDFCRENRFLPVDDCYSQPNMNGQQMARPDMGQNGMNGQMTQPDFGQNGPMGFPGQNGPMQQQGMGGQFNRGRGIGK